MVTAYDAPSAAAAFDAGIDVLLWPDPNAFDIIEKAVQPIQRMLDVK